MNDVHIKENELRPPTALNHTFNVNETKNNQNLGAEFEPTIVIPTKHLSNGHVDNDKPLLSYEDIIGSTTLDLSGASIFANEETLLGNTVADAFLMNSWDDTEISLVNSSSLLQKTLKQGNISRQMVNDLFPYGTTIDRVLISGTGLLKIFYASIASQKHKKSAGQEVIEGSKLYFQISGIKVTFDNNPEKPIVESIKIACQIQKDCSPITIQKWCQLNVTRNYTVAITSDLVGKNGTGVGIFNGLILDREVGDLDREVFSNYITECSPMKQALTGRIINRYNDRSRFNTTNNAAPLQNGTTKLVNETTTKMKSSAHRNDISSNLNIFAPVIIAFFIYNFI